MKPSLSSYNLGCVVRRSPPFACFTASGSKLPVCIVELRRYRQHLKNPGVNKAINTTGAHLARPGLALIPLLHACAFSFASRSTQVRRLRRHAADFRENVGKTGRGWNTERSPRPHLEDRTYDPLSSCVPHPRSLSRFASDGCFCVSPNTSSHTNTTKRKRSRNFRGGGGRRNDDSPFQLSKDI